MNVIGIDPGFSGGIALLSPRSAPIVLPMPVLKVGTKTLLDEQSIKIILEAMPSPKIAVIEKVGAMPKQGVTSMFSFGCGYGILRGIMVGLGIPYDLVRPQSWKKVMCRDVAPGKGASVVVSKRHWPGINLRATPRCPKDHDGLADALLIAEYGRRMLVVNDEKGD